MSDGSDFAVLMAMSQSQSEIANHPADTYARIRGEALIEGQREGRRCLAAEVSGIIGTLSARKDAYAVINELIALLRREGT